jgi:hypothetical protein
MKNMDEIEKMKQDFQERIYGDLYYSDKLLGLKAIIPEDKGYRVTHTKAIWPRLKVLFRYGVWARYEPPPPVGGIDRSPSPYWRTRL